MRQHAYIQLRFWCFVFLVPAAQLWAADLIGNVARIDAASRSITLVLLPSRLIVLGENGQPLAPSEKWKTPVPGEYSITVKPGAIFWRVPTAQTDLSETARHLENATAINLEDVSVGDRVLVRGERAKGKMLAAVIIDEGARYPASHSHGTSSLGAGTLSVVGASVSYAEPGMPDHRFTISCRDFIKRRKSDYDWATITNKQVLHVLDAAEQAIRQPCAEVLRKADALAAEEAARRRKAAAEESARDREALAVIRAANFRGGILSALRAAEEPDPFASIRGDFDLGGSDSHQWKTSLWLPDAEKCALLKTTPADPASGSDWTFACTFRATGDGYEGMVKSVQSVLQLPYQPDERAVNINQVFFADPSKPTSRVFVAKINEATVGISVVAVRSTGASLTTPNAAPFSGVPTMLPTEPTVHGEVDKIASGPHTSMPPAQRSPASDAGVSGRTTMTVKNSTAYELSVFFDGTVSTKLALMPGASQELDLAPGTFRVAGRVAAANVLPFYGEETYASSARYSLTFYIGR
jgi:hypothetical protein